MKADFQTVNFISDGYWMQGEFTVFLTLDETNKIFIEMYSFDENKIEPIVPPFQLADTAHHEHLEVCCSASR